jgi:nitroreductase
MSLRSLIARRTARSFTTDDVSVETVQQLVEVARWTGSARNRQPWRFVAVYEPSVRASLARLGAYAGHVADAPVVLVLLSPAEQRLDTEFDLGRMAQSVTLAAAESGLGSCIVSLYPAENAHAAAGLVGAGPGWVARHAIALGHPAPPQVSGRSAIPQGRLEVSELLQVL